ncbi:MAG: hypothetical protein MJZ68_03045 [archaeon]|nr:hypothetical protein [archaeon]
MDNKIILAIAVVGIVVVAGVVGVFTLGNDSEDPEPIGSTDSMRLYIFGNANNDDYLDNKDVKVLEQIIADGTWDKSQAPYADANQDGKITQDDVDVVKKMINKEPCKMYYIAESGATLYLNFPLSADKISCTLDYGLIVCSILGLYDNVKGVEHKVWIKDETRYPGLHSKEDLGDQRSDAALFVDTVLGKDYTVVMGRAYQDTYDLLRAAPEGKCEHIMLNYTKDYGNGRDCISALLMTAYMFGIPEKGHEYCAYFDKIHNDVLKVMEGAEEKTFIMTYANVPFTPGFTEVTVETSASSGGSFGTYWFASLLPLKTVAKPAANGEYKMLIEDLITADPDYIILTLWGITDNQPAAEAQKLYDDYAQALKMTRAYKEGHIYGVTYESIGTQLGIASLPVLASAIWPDKFNEDEAYAIMQETYDTYSDLQDGYKVKDLTGLRVFKVNTPA